MKITCTKLKGYLLSHCSWTIKYIFTSFIVKDQQSQEKYNDIIC